MKNTPVFSVIIPTYNTGKLIGETLDSLVAQSFKDFEVIISDDGSTDETLTFVNPYKNKLNIKIIYGENWGGPAHPRNAGIKQAMAPWIAFLDHDDTWEANKLEICATLIETNDVIFHDLQVFNNEKKLSKVVRGRSLGNDPFIDLMVNGNAIANSSVVVRKKIIEDVNFIDESRELLTVEDYDLWLKIALKTNRFCYIPQILGGYRIEANQMSSASLKKIERHTFVHKKYSSFLSEENQKRSNAFLAYSLARIYHQLSMLPKARSHYFAAVYSQKLIIKFKALAGLLLTYLNK